MNEKEENIKIEKLSELLKKSPTDDGTFYGTLYNLYVLIQIAKGVNNIKEGNSISLDKFSKEMEALYGNTIRKFG